MVEIRGRIRPTISVTLDHDLLAKIDKARGKIPRSVYVQDILADYFRGKKEGKI